jgi:hypothetical protein
MCIGRKLCTGSFKMCEGAAQALVQSLPLNFPSCHHLAVHPGVWRGPLLSFTCSHSLHQLPTDIFGFVCLQQGEG